MARKEGDLALGLGEDGALSEDGTKVKRAGSLLKMQPSNLAALRGSLVKQITAEN